MRRRGALLALLAAGATLRLVFLYLEVADYHPDAIFQYVEPAYRHVMGYGATTWEWDRGARSWILPGINGAWLALLEGLGIHDGRLFQQLVRVEHLVWSLTLIPAAYRLGVLLGAPRRRRRVADGLPGGEGSAGPVPGRPPRGNGAVVDPGAHAVGLSAAAAVAFLPALVYYSGHTLSEVPAMVLTFWAYVAWIQLREGTGSRARNAFALGLLVGAAAVLRPPSLVVAVLPGLDLLVRRQGRAIAWALLGVLPPIGVLALVDGLAWGIPLHSAIEWFAFNLLEGGARVYGEYDLFTYGLWIAGELGLGLVVAGPAFLAALWRGWPVVLGAVIPFVALSVVGHKEDRFLLVGVWPLLATAVGIGAMRIVLAVRRRWRRFPRFLAGAALLLAWAVPAYHGLLTHGPADSAHRFSLIPPPDVGTPRWGLLDAQDWVGRQSNLTGLLVDPAFELYNAYTPLGRNVPQQRLQRASPGNYIYNYAILRANNTGDLARLAAFGFVPAAHILGTVVLHRSVQPRPALPQDDEMSVGGRGGDRSYFRCPQGAALVGLDVAVAPATDRAIASIRPRCHPLSAAHSGPDATPAEADAVGLTIGRPSNIEPTSVRCGQGMVVVGLVGRADHRIREIGLVCDRPVAEGDSEDTGPPGHQAETQTERLGLSRGSAYELRCPDGQVVDQVTGRGGRLVDSVGIACAPLETVDEAP